MLLPDVEYSEISLRGLLNQGGSASQAPGANNMGFNVPPPFLLNQQQNSQQQQQQHTSQTQQLQQMQMGQQLQQKIMANQNRMANYSNTGLPPQLMNAQQRVFQQNPNVMVGPNDANSRFPQQNFQQQQLQRQLQTQNMAGNIMRQQMRQSVST